MMDRNSVLNLACQNTDINEYLMTIYNLVVQDKYKTIVELGAGRSSVALTAAANKIEGQVYSIDLYKDALLRGGQNLKTDLFAESRFHFTEIDDMEMIKIWNKEIDFLFFDTSHLYEETKKEINAWFPWVKSGGKIFMHDTAHESGDGMGCRKALDEFLTTEEGKKYIPVHLLDTKILGASILIKL